MRSIKALFVSIAEVQLAMGNPFAKLVAWIAIAGQQIVPVFSMLRKYSDLKSSALGASVLIAGVIAILATRNANMRILSSEELPAVRLKATVILIVSTLIFVGVAKISPELSLLAYFIFAFSPIDKVFRPSSGDENFKVN